MSQSNFRWLARRGDIKRLFDTDQHVTSQWTFESPLWLGEMDGALEPRDDYGQLWVKTPVDAESPNTLWYTDDLGNDYQLTGEGGLGGDHFQSIYLAMLAGARENDETWGQVWVSSTISPGMTSIADDAEEFLTSSLWYTDDEGHDVAIVADANPILQSIWTFGEVTRFAEALDVVFSALVPNSGQIMLGARSSDPPAQPDTCVIYAKGADPHLYCRDADGGITQLTF